MDSRERTASTCSQQKVHTTTFGFIFAAYCVRLLQVRPVPPKPCKAEPLRIAEGGVILQVGCPFYRPTNIVIALQKFRMKQNKLEICGGLADPIYAALRVGSYLPSAEPNKATIHFNYSRLSILNGVFRKTTLTLTSNDLGLRSLKI